MKVFRHGDLALISVESLPNGVKASESRTLMRGSHGNNHDIAKGGTFYPKEEGQFVLGYLKASAGCCLLHPDHGEGEGAVRTASIPKGVYELRRQFEHRHEEMRQVID